MAMKIPTNTAKSPTDGAKGKPSALERIDTLETSYRVFTTSVRDAFNKVVDRLESNEKVLEAVTELFGADVVEKKVLELHKGKLEARMNTIKEAVDAAVADGRLLPLDDIKAENCLVVTQSYNAEGNLMYPTRVYNDVSEYIEEVRNLLVGKKVGDVVVLNDKSTVRVLEVWCQNVAPSDDSPTEEAPKTE